MALTHVQLSHRCRPLKRHSTSSNRRSTHTHRHSLASYTHSPYQNQILSHAGNLPYPTSSPLCPGVSSVHIAFMQYVPCYCSVWLRSGTNRATSTLPLPLPLPLPVPLPIPIPIPKPGSRRCSVQRRWAVERACI